MSDSSSRPATVRFCQSCAVRENDPAVRVCSRCGGTLGPTIPRDPAHAQKLPLGGWKLALLAPGLFVSMLLSSAGGSIAEPESTLGLVVASVLGWAFLLLGLVYVLALISGAA